MTEEIINKENENLDQESNFTAEEKLAMESGWKPEDEWDPDKGEWIDARTFNMRGELMERIKSQTSQLRGQDKKIGKLEQTLNSLAEHNKKMDEIAYKKALKDLQGLKKDAMEISDFEQVIEIDDQIADLKAVQKESEVVVDTSPEGLDDIHPQVKDWMDKNSWYESNITLRGAADALAAEIIKSYPELKNSPGEVLDKVSNRLKEEFPSKFGKTRKTPNQSVAEPGNADTSMRTKSSTKKYTSRHLNDLQLQIGKTFVETGAMKDLNEYAEQLAEMGELDAQKGA